MKIPNLRHRTEQYQRRVSRLWNGPSPTGSSGEAGPSQSQKGANSAPERASSSKLQTGFQFLTKDFQRFWMVDRCREGLSQRSAAQKRHKANWTRAPGKLRWGQGGEKLCCTWGECAHQAPSFLSCSEQGRHKTQAQQSLLLYGVPENMSGLGLRSACNSGPVPRRATWSLSSVDGVSTHAMSVGKPSEEMKNPRVSRRKEILKIRAEKNAIETRP